VLGRDPQNLDAVASLSDLAWTQGQWSEAAEALIVRAKLEKDPQILKEVFFRLGVIYAEKLPDRRWATKSFERVLSFDANDLRALEHLSTLSMAGGEWRQALAATERLVALDSTPAARVTHLHRIARILEEGYQDRKRAEEALRRATDADPGSTGALAAIVDFYTRVGDTASLRVNLDRIAANMRARLAGDPWDGASYRVLGRTLLARNAAGIAGSPAAGRAAAELAVAFGAGDDDDRTVAAEVQTRAQSQGGFGRGLGGLGIDDQLFHPSIPNGFRQIFRLLYDTLSKRFPADLRRGGVGKGDRLPRSGHPVRDVVARLAAELGVADFDVYISQAKPFAVAVEITDPLSVVLGAQIVNLGPAEVRFAAGRAMKLALSYMAVPALLGADELGVLLAAVIRQYDPTFAPIGVNPTAVSEETQRLARLIPKRMRDEIQRFAAEVSGVAFDRQGLWLGVQHTGNRAGLLASGSAVAALNVLVRTGGHAGILAARGDVQIDELLRFAVSNEHAEIRAAIDGS
jgi:cellulose synthase operon protein C